MYVEREGQFQKKYYDKLFWFFNMAMAAVFLLHWRLRKEKQRPANSKAFTEKFSVNTVVCVQWQNKEDMKIKANGFVHFMLVERPSPQFIEQRPSTA